MFRTKNLVFGLLGIVLFAAYFAYDVSDLAKDSICFDLEIIGRSVYEAHRNNGEWPAGIADLEGTEYIAMPYRRGLLEQGNFVIVWQKDLDPKPVANHDRVLAYDNRSLLSRFGSVWSVRGDLHVEKIPRRELKEFLKKVRN